MNSNPDFRSLWNEKTSAVPDFAAVKLSAEKMKRSHFRKIIFTNLAFLFTSLFIIWIWISYRPEFISTKIGIVMIILAMFIFVMSYNRSIPLLKNADSLQSSSDYLKSLLKLRENQNFIQTTMLNIYFIMLSSGLALYMYEYASRMSPEWEIAVYGITAAWILFNWFYLRPKQIKKQTQKLNDVIQRFEGILHQTESE